jgi:hypothetical protein
MPDNPPRPSGTETHGGYPSSSKPVTGLKPPPKSISKPKGTSSGSAS